MQFSLFKASRGRYNILSNEACAARPEQLQLHVQFLSSPPLVDFLHGTCPSFSPRASLDDTRGIAPTTRRRKIDITLTIPLAIVLHRKLHSLKWMFGRVMGRVAWWCNEHVEKCFFFFLFKRVLTRMLVSLCICIYIFCGLYLICKL